MTSILLLRHGQSTWNAEGRWQGWADPPLTALGEQQAEQAAEALAALGPDAVASSDLQRARRTADIVAVALGTAPVAALPELRERNVGAWSGLTFPQIEAGWPGLLASYREGRFARPPGGEDSATLVARATEGLRLLAARFPGARVVAVSHGGVIRSLERSLGAGPSPGGVPNLAGRWFTWSENGLAAGDTVAPLDPDLATSPPAR